MSDHCFLAVSAIATRQSFADRIVEDIVTGIADGRYRRGERLVEAKLTLRHGVARGPVREALARLAAQGVVVVERNRGATIRRAPRHRVIESLELLEVILGLAGRRAAARIGVPGAAASLTEAAEAVFRFAADDGSAAHGAARIRFFDVITAIADSSEIARQVPQLRFCFVGPAFKGLAETVNQGRHEELRKIAGTILAGDEAGAEAAMRHHVSGTTALVRSMPADWGG